MPSLATDKETHAELSVAFNRSASREPDESGRKNSTPAMKTVAVSTIELKSDVHNASREAHTSGMLHAIKHSDSNGEEHCFAWISDTSFYPDAYEYLSKYGFTKVVFIPYTCKKAWMVQYPYLPVCIHIDEEGNCVGTPNGKTSTSSASSNKNVFPQSKTAKRRKTKNKKKLFEGAMLSHFERDCLHIQMHSYFSWLSVQLEKLEEEENGKRMMARAGVSRRVVDSLIDGLEGFKAVEHYKENSDVNFKDTLPFLEKGLVKQLETMVEVTVTKDGDEGPKKRRRVQNDSRSRAALDFDEMFERLIQFQEIHGHVNVPNTRKGDVNTKQLASWVTNMRQKKKKFDKQQLLKAEEPVTSPGGTEKRRRGQSAILDQEKIDKLDSVGFTWSFESDKKPKKWEERYQDLVVFKEKHGHCNVSRSEGAFGEWVHKQRREYRNREKNFMKKRFKLLQDIGFDFRPRRTYMFSWDAGMRELEAFGRLNGHYNVPCPVPEHLEEEGYQGEDPRVANALRLYTWVNRLRDEYPIYLSAGHSRLLNEERVKQLDTIGFMFA